MAACAQMPSHFCTNSRFRAILVATCDASWSRIAITLRSGNGKVVTNAICPRFLRNEALHCWLTGMIYARKTERERPGEMVDGKEESG